MNICERSVCFFLLYLLSLSGSGETPYSPGITISSDTTLTFSDTIAKTIPAPITFSYKNVRDYIFNQLSYPQAAIDSTIQGTVVLKFTIMPSGIVDSLRITQPVHPLLDAEALRLFKEMPQWKPVIYQGKPIAVTYEIPVIFELVDPEKK